MEPYMKDSCLKKGPLSTSMLIWRSVRSRAGAVQFASAVELLLPCLGDFVAWMRLEHDRPQTPNFEKGQPAQITLHPCPGFWSLFKTEKHEGS